LLWQKVATHPEAVRIVSLFPSADIVLIKHQRLASVPDCPAGQALRKGKRLIMIGETSSFVGDFDGQLGSNVRCCPYYKLVPISNGCPYYCTYCYLAFVYRKFSPFIKININYNTMFKQIREVSGRCLGRVNFNMGEMLDSFALDHVTGLTKILIPFFSHLPNSYLMLLTKSSNVDNLLALRPNAQTVLSWSLNSQQIVKIHERGTANLDDRLTAAKLCQQHGYRIRFRIDPGILYPSWQADYGALIQKALSVSRPENITLGMLRLFPGHFGLAIKAYGNRARKLCDHSFVKGAADGKLRYSPKERIEFYTFLIDAIRSLDRSVSISLCRETSEIWEVFKDRCTPRKCNCVTW